MSWRYRRTCSAASLCAMTRNWTCLLKLRVRSSQIGAGHIDTITVTVAKTSYKATVATVEVWFGVGVAIVLQRRVLGFIGVLRGGKSRNPCDRKMSSA